MNVRNWDDLIRKAVTEGNDELISSLAEQLGKCEKAHSILRAKGYGKQGQTIDATVASVPNAREWG